MWFTEEMTEDTFEVIKYMGFNTICSELVSGKEKLAIVGLGYVGMPIAVAFAKKANVIGFDLNTQKILQYRKGFRKNKRIYRCTT